MASVSKFFNEIRIDTFTFSFLNGSVSPGHTPAGPVGRAVEIQASASKLISGVCFLLILPRNLASLGIASAIWQGAASSEEVSPLTLEYITLPSIQYLKHIG